MQQSDFNEYCYVYCPQNTVAVDSPQYARVVLPRYYSGKLVCRIGGSN